MASKTNYFENKLIDQIFRGQAFSFPGTLYVALFTAARLTPLMLGPLSGVISDRFDRVRLLLIAAGWAFATMAVIATLVSLG